LVNACFKGIAGNAIPLNTDADVLFFKWQSETKIFNQVPPAGVVGIVPQFKMYEGHCGCTNFSMVKCAEFKIKKP
jgi:hypothetical protein